jgi:predicted phage-related endonuclease
MERVRTQNPPPVDGSERTAEALKRLYRQEVKGQTVVLSGEAIQWNAQRQEADEQIKRAELIRREALNHIMAEVGAAEVGLLPGGDFYSFREKSVKEYTVSAKTYRELRFHKGKAGKVAA